MSKVLITVNYRVDPSGLYRTPVGGHEVRFTEEISSHPGINQIKGLTPLTYIRKILKVELEKGSLRGEQLSNYTIRISNC